MNHEFICIVCPRGCHLYVETTDGNLKVMGAGCRRGERFAKEEITDPRRNLTTTVQTSSQDSPRLPVRTDRPMPKAMLLDASAALAAVTVHPPVRRGDVIVKNILGSGSNIIVSADMVPEIDGEDI